MPRSFLIANKRYGSSQNFNKSNNIHNHSCDSDIATNQAKSLLNDNNNYNNSPNKNNQNDDEKLTKNEDESITTFEDDNRHLKTKTSKQSTNVDNHNNSTLKTNLQKTDISNIKVIINFAPTPNPFQNPNTINGNISNSNEIHTCPDCGKSYSTSSNLTRHRQTHRSVTDKKARKCPHCDKIYVSMPAYSMHVRTHTQGCQCHFCGKCFSRPWLLQGHIRTHTGEKPFKCHICNKAFADKSNLRAHVQTHSLTKPFICRRCGKAFALKSYLYKHEESSCMRMQRELNRFKRNHQKNSPVNNNPANRIQQISIDSS